MTRKTMTREGEAEGGTSPTPVLRPVANAPEASGDTAAEIDAAVAATLDPARLAPEDRPEMKTRELVDLVVSRSGEKKKVVKPIVEAMLATLRDQLSDGREMTLKPLGKLKIQRRKDTGNGALVVARIKLDTVTKSPLAPRED